jgi:hypothetical protein
MKSHFSYIAATRVAGAVALAGALMMPGIAAAQSRTTAVDAGPIWNQADANKKCPVAAANYGGAWDGQWWTTVPGKMSVCEVKYSVKAADAGPIWNQADANKKCPAVAKAQNGVWDGQWWTTVPGQMSVCEIRVPA